MLEDNIEGWINELERNQLHELYNATLLPVIKRIDFKTIGLGIAPNKGIILYGPSGSGKSRAISLLRQDVKDNFREQVRFLSVSGIEFNTTVLLKLLESITDFLIEWFPINNGGIQTAVFQTPQPKKKTQSVFSFKSLSEELHKKSYARIQPKTSSEVSSGVFKDKKVVIELVCFNLKEQKIILQQLLAGRFHDQVITKLYRELSGKYRIKFKANFLKLLNEAWKNVQFVIEVVRLDSVPQELVNIHYFDKTINFGTFDARSRKIVFKSLLKEDHIENTLTDEELHSIADNTAGFLPVDFLSLLKKLKDEAPVTFRSFTQLLIAETGNQIVKSNENQTSPNTYWKQVAGYENIKTKITQSIIWPILHPEIFKHFKLAPVKGILFYGPPGCGKSTFARAISSIMSSSFISLDVVDVFCSPYFGEAEQKVRLVFDNARRALPCVIFIDEIDSIVGNRFETKNESESAVHRVLSTLLNEMDGISTVPGMLVLAATNKLQNIDKALLRPGRFDVLIEIPLPDNPTKIELMKHFLAKMSISQDLRELFLNITENQTSCKRRKEFLSLSQGLSGADLKNICKQAGLAAIRSEEEAINVSLIISILETYN